MALGDAPPRRQQIRNTRSKHTKKGKQHTPGEEDKLTRTKISACGRSAKRLAQTFPISFSTTLEEGLVSPPTTRKTRWRLPAQHGCGRGCLRLIRVGRLPGGPPSCHPDIER